MAVRWYPLRMSVRPYRHFEPPHINAQISCLDHIQSKRNSKTWLFSLWQVSPRLLRAFGLYLTNDFQDFELAISTKPFKGAEEVEVIASRVRDQGLMEAKYNGELFQMPCRQFQEYFFGIPRKSKQQLPYMLYVALKKGPKCYLNTYVPPFAAKKGAHVDSDIKHPSRKSKKR